MSDSRDRTAGARAAAVRAKIVRAGTTLAWTVLPWIVLAWVGLAWIVAGSLVPADLAMADAHGPPQTQELTQLADGAGRDLTVGRCIICHSLEYIPSNSPAMNRAGWEKTIKKMRDRFGAPITDAEAGQILDYLATNYSGKP